MSLKLQHVNREEKIFIIYDRADSTEKEEFSRCIRNAYPGASVIADTTDEPFSKPWMLRTQDRIRQARRVFCLIGAETFLHNSVSWELTLAYMQKKEVIGVRLHRNHLHMTPFMLVDKGAPIIEDDLESLLALQKTAESIAKKAA
jgi:hypothetical protein